MRILVALSGLVAMTLALTTIPTTTLPGTSIKLSESKPWHLINLVIFEAKPGKNCSSHITFAFEDTNKKLSLNTTCTHTAKSGSSSLVSSRYQHCANEYVAFMYNGTAVQVERFYRDSSLGDPPYDRGIAFGHVGLNLTATKVEEGVWKTQSGVYVPISSLMA